MPPLSISRNPRCPPIMKNRNLIGIKSLSCCKNNFFDYSNRYVHFWNEYVPCQCKKNQSKEPGDMLLSSKIVIASIKHPIWCREMIQGF